jgi:hypothetical protein
MANLNDWAQRYRLGHSSATPFSSFGLEWCPRCRMEVDCDTQAHHQGTTYVYKRWCLRCGRVIKRGVYDNVVMLSGQPLPAAALEWSTSPGQDRSK